MPVTVAPAGWLVPARHTDRYQVVGTQIEDPTGATFYPFGVNTAVKHTSYNYVFEWPPWNTDTISSYSTFGHHIGAAKDWGFNFLRVNAVPWNADGGGPTPGGDPSLVFDLMQPGIDQLITAGFVVMPASHTPVPGSNPTWGDTDDLRVREFWTQALTYYADEPNFWINPFNEPFNLEGSSGAATAITLYTNWIGFLRDLGYKQPIVFDITRQGQGIDDVARGYWDDFMALDDNMLLSWHGYGVATGSSGFTIGSDTYSAYSVTKADNASLAAHANARGIPMIIGEFGKTIDGTTATGTVAGQENVVDWALNDGGAEALDMGMVAWHAGHDAYSLMVASTGYTQYGWPFWNYTETSANGTGLDVTHARSTYGVELWNKGQALDLAGHIVVP